MDSGSLLRKVPFLSSARNDRVAGNLGKLLAKYLLCFRNQKTAIGKNDFSLVSWFGFLGKKGVDKKV